MTPRVEIHNEDEELPPLSTSFGRRRVRKLSLVQELIQTYDIDESHLDGAGRQSDTEGNTDRQTDTEKNKQTDTETKINRHMPNP